MKLSSRQDIDVPLDFLYAQLSDFAQFERMAMRRGAEVQRLDKLTQVGPGLSWRLRFAFKGKPRKVEVTLVTLTPEEKLSYDLDSPSVVGGADFTLTALSPSQSRLSISLEVTPKTMAARLLVQSMRLAKGRVNRKFDASCAKLAQLIHERWLAHR